MRRKTTLMMIVVCYRPCFKGPLKYVLKGDLSFFSRFKKKSKKGDFQVLKKGGDLKTSANKRSKKGDDLNLPIRPRWSKMKTKVTSLV